MTGFDILLIVVFIIGCYAGYKDGFLMGVFSFLALVLGVLGAFKLMGLAIIYLTDWFDISERILPYVAFAVVFLAIVIAVRLLGNLIRLSIDKTFLGRLDQLAGAVLGFFKTLFVLSILVWITDALNFSLSGRWAEDSLFLPYIINFAPKLTGWISEWLPFFKNIF